MRHLPTARGQHHKATANTKRLFAFKEGSGTSVADLVSTTTLALAGAPAWGTDGWIGPSHLRFDGTNDAATGGAAGADAATLTATTWTIGLVYRRRANSPGVVFAYAGNAGTAAANILARLSHNGSGVPTFRWESGTATLQTDTVAGYAFPLDRWVYVHLVRTTATAVQFWVNGRLVDTLDMVAGNNDGSGSSWHVGVDEDDASSFLNGDVGSLYLESGAIADTVIFDDVRRATLQAFPTTVHCRVRMEDALGALQDMTNFMGHDWVESVTIDESVEDACATAKVELTREHDFLSLAWLMTTSKANLTDPMNLASYDPAVFVQRDVYIDFARVPHMHSAESTDWANRFRGHVDRMDPAQNPIPVDCRDQGGQLVDDFTTTDLEMPLTSGAACTDDPVTGEKRASVEEAIQDITGVAPYAPTAANLCLIPWEQAKDSKMTIARKIAGVKAWDFRYAFDESPSQNTFRQTLVDPGRDRVENDGVMSALDYESLGRCEIDVFGIRTQVFITWPNRDNRNSDGFKLPKTSTYANTAARDKYGGFHRSMFLTEDQAGPIDEQSEADTMGNGILDDLKDPTVQVEAPLHNCFFEAERNDYYTFVGDDIHYTGDQRLAVTAVSITYADGVGEASVGCRGKASAGQRRWLAKDGRPGMNPSPWSAGGGTSSQDNVSHGIVRRELVQAFDFASHSVRQGIGVRGALTKNPDFDRWTLGSGYCPDGWYSGGAAAQHNPPSSNITRVRSLPVNVDVINEGGKTVTAARALYFNKSVFGGTLISDAFQVEGGRYYAVEAIARQDTLGDPLYFFIDWYDVAKVYISNSQTARFWENAAANLGVFRRVGPAFQGSGDFLSLPVQAPSTARYARIAIGHSTEAVANTADFYLDYAGAVAVPYEVDATLSATMSPIADNTWTTLTGWTEARDLGASFNAATGVWTAPEDGLYTFKCRLEGRVSGANNCTFETLNVRILDSAGSVEVDRSPSAQHVETTAANPATGYATVTHEDYFVKGKALVFQGLLGRVTGTTPVRAFTAARLRIKQRPPGS